MKTFSDSPQLNPHSPVRERVAQNEGKDVPGSQGLDRRPEGIAQMKLNTQAEKSPHEVESGVFQKMANNGPQINQAIQLQAMADHRAAQTQSPTPKTQNKTGLPDKLKTGVENLSGLSLNDVKVHRNSEKPAQLQAHAYAKGTDIHLGPGQEKHLPHEAWHVVQQKQGRVKPTVQMKGKVNVNDDITLEREADVMGAKALQHSSGLTQTPQKDFRPPLAIVQRVARRGAPAAAGNVVRVYRDNGAAVGNLIIGAEFDLESDQVAIGGHQSHRIEAMNGADYDGVDHDDLYVRHADIQLLAAAHSTYADVLQEGNENAAHTTDRLKAGRYGARRGVGHSDRFADAARAQAACFNFAVGSFRAANDQQHLQAAASEYVMHRYGGMDGQIKTQAVAMNAVETGGQSITAGRATVIDNLMVAAGMRIDPAGAQNPSWFEGANGVALRVALKMPLQYFVLRESGLRPNPDGNWAIGFRGQATDLGSDHAWVKAIDPEHPNRYISFDTFPNYRFIQGSRKMHSDPYEPGEGEVDFQVRITGPTAEQFALIEEMHDIDYNYFYDLVGSDNRVEILPDEAILPQWFLNMYYG